jgi:hypothetical protein
MTIILNIHKAEIWRIMIQGQPGQKVNETPISTKKGRYGGAYLPS